MTGPRPGPFYPVVPDATWVARIVPLGVKFIQLRVKGKHQIEVRRQIADCLDVCRAEGATLVVNDYWDAAIDLGATYVHLGQEDVKDADLAALRRAGIRLGLSTHDDAELDAALSARPDYIALGPIYETTLKAMRWAPQGLDRIRVWKRRVGKLPLVAIGGLTLERAPSAIAAGAQSIAVVGDVIGSASPDDRVRHWLRWSCGVEYNAPPVRAAKRQFDG